MSYAKHTAVISIIQFDVRGIYKISGCSCALAVPAAIPHKAGRDLIFWFSRAMAKDASRQKNRKENVSKQKVEMPLAKPKESKRG